MVGQGCVGGEGGMRSEALRNVEVAGQIEHIKKKHPRIV
ncbi:hypothetical protein L21SP2_1954 [Salinispira pacifica]|uniref:Uncharacterized protein n=1 Tax=Salinispira pacifica TaxID=1307761 RepID=V5WI70_9SPIO|nr:hypothetical protein L21SP2_1954 [Salinispira pacifica]